MDDAKQVDGSRDVHTNDEDDGEDGNGLAVFGRAQGWTRSWWIWHATELYGPQQLARMYDTQSSEIDHLSLQNDL